MYSLDEIRAALDDTSIRGEIHHLRSTGSTNQDARQAALNGAPHGSVWLAEEQTAGRGRGDHSWHSEAGLGLYASILIRPVLTNYQLQWLPLITGLAAAEAIESEAGLSVDIRWPNDLLIGPLKVGGILVESRLSGARVDFAVIGIGINLYQQSFPPELGATSLALELHDQTQLIAQELLIALLTALDKELANLNNLSSRAELNTRLLQHSTWLNGRMVHVHGPLACTGLTAGLDANGLLLVETGDGLLTITTGGIRDAS